MVNDFALHQLGTKSAYFDEYNPHLLEKVSRAPSRASFRIATNHGFDIWRLYEITYLNRLSIPEVAMGIITIPATSPFIVESKSLKLYLWSFRNEGCFHEHVVNRIMDDLVKALDPVWCEVLGRFNARGGIAINVRASSGKKPDGID